MMKVYEKALKILDAYGTVFLFSAEGENKVVHSLKDLKAAFKLAQNGVIDEWVEAR